GVDGATPVLALPAGKTVLRFLPPLIIGQEELAQVVEALRRACERQ
ncbi:MAG: aminotransferase class III-fold pyridoxal phosphate-dependent enzyme, partial [Chloroflexi bacterium]